MILQADRFFLIGRHFHYFPLRDARDGEMGETFMARQVCNFSVGHGCFPGEGRGPVAAVEIKTRNGQFRLALCWTPAFAGKAAEFLNGSRG